MTNSPKKLSENHESKNFLKNKSQKIIESTRAAILSILIASGGYYLYEKILQDDPIVDVSKEKQEKKEQFRKENSITKNFSGAYAYTYSHLKKWEFIVVDKEWRVIEWKQSFPEKWDSLSENEKQKFRDKIRREFSQKFQTTFTDKNSSFISTHKLLNDDGKSVEDLLQENINKKVVGDKKERNRKEFLEDSFQNIIADNDEISKYFSENIAWLAAGESGFDNGKTSKSGAIGILQLMPHMIENDVTNPNKYSIEEVKNSLAKQTEIAKNLFADNYKKLSKRNAKKLADAYFDGDEEQANRYFIAPATINAYNTGITIINNGIDNFLKKYPTLDSVKKDLPAKYGKNHPQWDIFLLFIKTSKNDIKNYGEDASNYNMKVWGLSQALKTNKEIEPTTIVIGKKSDEQSKKIEKSNTTESSEKGLWEKTKDFMGDLFSNDENEASKEKAKSVKNLSQSEKEELFYAPSKIKKLGELKGEYLFGKTEKFIVPTQIQSTVLTPWLNDFSKEFDLEKSASKRDFKHLPKMPEASDFEYIFHGVWISDSGEKFTNNPDIYGDIDLQKNDADYTRLHENAQADIVEIQNRLKEILHKKYGLDEKYTPTLVLSSIGRDQEYIDKAGIFNASKNSAHFYGIAWDISTTYAVITDTQKKKWIRLSGDDAKIYFAAMSQALDDMRQEWKIFVNEEFKIPHFHVQSRLSNTGIFTKDKNWIPPDNYFEKHYNNS